MNGVIIYGSFHGTTEMIARKLGELLSLSVVNVNAVTDELLASLEYIVVGSSVQWFRLHPSIQSFFVKKCDVLKNKKIFLYVSSADPMIVSTLMGKLPREVQDSVVAHTSCGGKIDWKKNSFYERLSLSLIGLLKKKNLKGLDSVNMKRIEKFSVKVSNYIKTTNT